MQCYLPGSQTLETRGEKELALQLYVFICIGLDTEAHRYICRIPATSRLHSGDMVPFNSLFLTPLCLHVSDLLHNL
jgi:hypothetical protein